MKYVVGILMMIGGVIFGLVAISYVLWQQKAVTQFVEVPATILSSTVHVTHGKSTSYSPEITYSYVYEGQTYQSSQVFTFSYSTSSSSEARGVVDRYPVALPIRAGGPEAVTVPNAKAYVNPSDPNDAILVREYLFTPYVFSMVAFFIALVSLGAMTTDAFSTGREKMAAIALDDSGWQLLLPKQNLQRRFRNALIWAIGAAVIVLPVIIHWFVVLKQFSIESVIGCAIPFTFLVVFLVSLIRRWNVSRHISDVRLRVRPAPMQRGQNFFLELEADALSALRVSAATARVVCTEHYKERRGNKTSIGTRTRSETKVDLCGTEMVAAGQVVDGQAQVVFQIGDVPPTTDTTIRNYPYFTWEVRVAVALEGMADYAGVFPLQVV